MDVVYPWIDSSFRFEISDEKAQIEWGDDAVESWCRKAHEALKDSTIRKRLDQWRNN